MSKHANQLEKMLAEQEKIMGRKYVRSDDLPSSEDILGINGHDGKKFTFVTLMQCGAIDYLAVREWSKTPPSFANMMPMYTPQLSEVYFVERVSAPREKPKAAKVPKNNETAQSEHHEYTPAKSHAPTSIAESPKRGRGRPKGSGKKVTSTKVTTAAPKRGRGRPRKIAS